MSVVVWKYNLPNHINYIDMPGGAEILNVGVQETGIVLWAKVTTEAANDRRRFITFWTGDSLPEIDLKYIGTCTMRGLVYHVFEII